MAGALLGGLDLSGRHACALFTADGDRQALVGGFLAAGIAAGAQVLYLSDGTSTETVAGYVGAAGLDGASCLRSGQLRVERTVDTYLAGGRFDATGMQAALRRRIDDALADGWAGLWVTGEMTWARRGAPGSDVLGDYERDVNALFGDGTLVALCQYDRRAFDDDTVAALARHHEVCASATGGGGFVACRGADDAVRLAGDLDFTDAAVLAACLDGRTEVDLDGVEFLDIAAIRVLVSTAAALPEGRVLRLRNAPPLVRRVLALTGWDAAPQLAVA